MSDEENQPEPVEPVEPEIDEPELDDVSHVEFKRDDPDKGDIRTK